MFRPGFSIDNWEMEHVLRLWSFFWKIRKKNIWTYFAREEVVDKQEEEVLHPNYSILQIPAR